MRREPRFSISRHDRNKIGAYEQYEKQRSSRESSFNNRHTTVGSPGTSFQPHMEQAPQRVTTKITYGNGDFYEGEVQAERRDTRDGQGVFYCSNK